MASLARFVTISVDDGHPTDLRTAELLAKYGLKATFYVPAANPEREVLDASRLCQLASHFELGGHTMGHVVLNSVSADQAWKEISDCRAWLQDVTGKPVVSFCYPKGKADPSIAELVRKAGFRGARTCMFHRNDFPSDPFLWGVSTHAYTHSHSIQMRHALLERNFAGAWNYWKTYRGAREWNRHFQLALQDVATHGGIAHLYMHSWEIDQLGQWNLLESVFQQIAAQDNLLPVTNGDLFQMWPLYSKQLATRGMGQSQ